MKINVLVDDFIDEKEHGLSIYIEASGKKILFDTAQTNNFLVKMEKLEIREEELDLVVISHGHYDHGNGLRYLSKDIPIFLHEDAIKPKYKNKDGIYYFNGISNDAINVNRRNFNLIKADQEIASNIFVLANIKTDKKNENFFLDEKKNIVDDFHDEIILAIQENNDLTLFLGCSHFGIVEGIRKAKECFPHLRIKNVVAGMHLLNDSEKEILKIIDQLKLLGVFNVIPLHCTGELAAELFLEEFGENCILISSSESIYI